MEEEALEELVPRVEAGPIRQVAAARRDRALEEHPEPLLPSDRLERIAKSGVHARARLQARLHHVERYHEQMRECASAAATQRKPAVDGARQRDLAADGRVPQATESGCRCCC